MRRFVLTLCLCLAVVAAGASAAQAASRQGHHHISNAEAVRAYVAAIRYFNPGVDEFEARRIVAAIARESIAAALDPRLVVAVVAVESSFDHTARSPAGAMGLGQLMPATASMAGVLDTKDIDENIHGTVLTLHANLAHYARLDPQHQFIYAIAAYNAGSGAVDEYGGVPPYDETIRYVWKVVVLWRRLTGLSATSS